MRSINIALLCASAMLVTGCAGTKVPASVSNGIDGIFQKPPHEIKGATSVDQDWIDETVEAGMTCCWKGAIAPRPPELDATKPAVVAAKSKAADKPKPKKRSLRARLLHPFKKQP